MRRIFLSLLLAWVALAPAVANSCAADCETGSAATVAANIDADSALSMSDCHGVDDPQQDPADDTTQDAGMVAACVFAATASMSIPSFASPAIAIDTRHMPVSQRAPASALLSPPDKPPQR